MRPPVGAPEAGAVGGHGAAQVSRGPVLLAPPLPNLVLDGCLVQLLRDGLAAKERLQREVGEDEAPRIARKVGDGVGHGLEEHTGTPVDVKKNASSIFVRRLFPLL